MVATRLDGLQHAETQPRVERGVQILARTDLRAIVHAGEQAAQHARLRQTEESHHRTFRPVGQAGQATEQLLGVQHEWHEVHAETCRRERRGPREQFADLAFFMAVQADHAETAGLADRRGQFRLRHAAHARLQHGQASAEQGLDRRSAQDACHGGSSYSAARSRPATRPCLLKKAALRLNHCSCTALRAGCARSALRIA